MLAGCWELGKRFVMFAWLFCCCLETVRKPFVRVHALVFEFWSCSVYTVTFSSLVKSSFVEKVVIIHRGE